MLQRDRVSPRELGDGSRNRSSYIQLVECNREVRGPLPVALAAVFGNPRANLLFLLCSMKTESKNREWTTAVF